MARYDIHFNLVRPSDQESRNAIFTWDARQAVSIRGPQKVANRFLKALLSGLGTNPLHRKDGTTVTSLFNGNVSDRESVETALTLSVSDVEEQLKEIDRESPWLDADERLRGADVRNFNQLDETHYEILVELTTISGAKALALLPFALG